MKDNKSFFLNEPFCLPGIIEYPFYGIVGDQAFSILWSHHPYDMTLILMMAGDVLHLQPSCLLPNQEEGRRTTGLLPNGSPSHQTKFTYHWSELCHISTASWIAARKIEYLAFLSLC